MWFYIRFHRKYIKIWKMTPGGTKSENIERQGHQKWIERHQKWARGHQKWAKREPKGSNMEPKWSQKATKMHPKIDFRKTSILWSKKGACAWKVWVQFLDQKFKKIDKKSMQKSMSKKYGHLWKSASKIMPKWNPKSMTTLWIFGACDFLFLVKGITLKSFYHMIRGTRNQ